MSVSFFPKPPEDDSVAPEQLIWGSYFTLRHGYQNHLSPDQKALLESMDWDPGYAYWQKGMQPFEFWLDQAEKFGMSLEYDYPYSKTFVRRNGEAVLYSLTINGKRPEDEGWEMSIAQVNAETLLGLMGLKMSGCMNPVAFLKTLEQLSSRRDLTEFTTPMTDNGDDPDRSGPRIVDYGMPMERIQSYILGLEEICDHCIRYERDICWG